VRQHCRDAEVIHEASLSPYLVDPSGPHLEAAQQAMSRHSADGRALTREGGSIGAVVTMDRAAAPRRWCCLACPCPEHGYHAINENFDWGQAAGAWRCSAATLHKLQVSARRS